MKAITTCSKGHYHSIRSVGPAKGDPSGAFSALFPSARDFCQTCEEPIEPSSVEYVFEPDYDGPREIEMELAQGVQGVHCFGCTETQLRETVEGMASHGQSKAMSAMSMLSDAQEEISVGRREPARQLINRAKFIIAEYLATRDEHGRMVDPDAV